MSEGECVKVVVRCRPANTREKDLKSAKIVKIDRRTFAVSLVKGAEDPKTFTYDNVYDDDSLQKDVYDETAFPLVKSVMEGYNGTIFAYGQTGCGKTFTMEGIRESPVLRGIIPRTFDQIFEAINTDKHGGDTKFLVAISYVEIYNEEVRDLLSDNPKTRMEVKEDPEKGVFIKNLSYPEVTSVDQIEALMNFGNKNRSVGATAMNATSSRSHSLFTVRIETSSQVAGSDEAHIKAGKLNLVDLAGSERQSKTEATGDRLKEAQKINLSLSALGNVISALVVASGKGKGDVHIPYRDSKLTRLLQDSLGGNTKTIMIAAVSPAADNYEETLSTLRYANRAKNIKNKPKINEDPKDAMLREFQDEIKRLKAMLEGRGLDADSAAAGAPRRKKKSAAGGAEEESEEEEEEEDAAPRKKKVRKPKRALAEGEIAEEDDLESEDDDAASGSGGGGRKSKGRLGDFASPAEKRKFEEAAADFAAELARIQAEKDKHESFARMLEEQMAAEKEALIASMKQQTETEKAAALAEVEERLQRDKEEHEARAVELAAEIARTKSEESARAAALTAQISDIQNAALSEQLALKAKLKKLQTKMMEGGKAQKTAAQQAEEKARLATEEALALKQAEAREREERLRVEEEKLLLEENYSSIKDEVIGKTKKLKKLKRKYLQGVQEMEEARAEWEAEKEGLLAQIRESEREARLHRQIAAALLTKSDHEKIVRGSLFNEEKDAWILPRIDLPVFFPTVRLMPGATATASSSSSSSSGARGATRNGSSSRPSVSGSSALSNFNATSKFQEEKGTDSGWKKSVLAQYEREEYSQRDQGRAKAAAALAPSTAQAPRPTPSPPAKPVPAVAVPSRLDSLHGGANGGAARTPRQSSPDGGSSHDPLNANIPKRAAFDPTAGGSAVPPSLEGDRDEKHAHLLSVMEGTQGRGAFAPDRSGLNSSGGRAGLGGDNALDAAANVARKPAFAPGASPSPRAGDGTSAADSVLDTLSRHDPAKRAAFSPTGNFSGGASAAAAAEAHENLSIALANSPAKRAAFNPGAGAAAGGPAVNTSGSFADSLGAADAVPKRAAFEPNRAAAGGSSFDAGQPQTSLPSNLPAARSFQPGAAGSSFSNDSSAAADILSAHASLPARAAFRPAPPSGPSPFSSASGGANDALANAPPARASFAPGALGGSGPGGLAASPPPFQPAPHPALSFDTTRGATFKPAFTPQLQQNFPDTSANVFHAGTGRKF